MGGRRRGRVRMRVVRVSVGGVSHHAKLSNPRVGAVRGLLKEKRVGRVQTAVAVSKKPTSYSVVVCGPGL